MKKHVLLSCICLLLLVSLAAVPVLAATISCPSSCSCLLPADAKKLGYPGYCGGKQQVCGSDALQNVKFCYTKPVTTTTIVPQLIITAHPFVTTTPTTIPPQKCASGCTCVSSADGKGKGLLYCGGKQTLCGYNTDKTPLYCFALPTTPTTTPTIVTGLHVITTTPTPTPGVNTTLATCPAGCSCLAPDKADAVGFPRCNGTSAPCSYDPLGRPMYCYVADRVTMVSPVPADGTPAEITSRPPSDGPVPDVTRKAPTPSVHKMLPMRLTVTPSESVSAPGTFSAISRFFSTLLTGREAAGVSPGGGGVIKGCPFGTTLCDGECVDLRSDWMNCGRCRSICPGQMPLCCDGTCSSIISSSDCGSCGNACDTGEPCTTVSGWATCSPAGCEGTTRSTDCGTGLCIDLEWDSSNCGACGNACPAHSQCIFNTCTPCPAGSDRCGDGSLASGGYCDNIVSNPWACGGCGIVCDPSMICEAGTCVSCPAGKVRCGSSCVNLNTDRNNCGTCGNYCYDASSGGTTCCAGQCTGLQTNETHCGICGRACSAGQTCVVGSCLLMPDAEIPDITCRIGQTACRRTCVSLESDESNCGACGHACSSDQVCIEGDCLTAGGEDGCGLGQVRCSGRCVYLERNRDNCGRCGHECADWYTCRESTCTPYSEGDDTVCEEPGLDFCNDECVDERTDTRHCGACRNACLGGTCDEGICYDTNSDSENCGSVGNRCGAGQACCGGRCQTDRSDEPDMCGPCGIPCTYPGLGCCNGLCWDLANDKFNCGTCGNVCSGDDKCCGGRCVNTRWDEDNCMYCGNDCPWNKECQNGRCCLWGTTWGCD